jgi:large subunit ribosomal protein L22
LLNALWIKPKNMEKTKIIMARSSFVKSSPRKLRLIANAVRAMDPNKAIDHLKLMPLRAAQPLLAVFQQALANAKNTFQLSPADMKIVSLQIHEGPRGPKKADVHSHGSRFARGVRRKKMSHITLELTERTRYGT